jgi:hypothetical protein
LCNGEDVVVLKDYLGSDELIVDRFSAISYNNLEYDCALTNQRILLYKKNIELSTEINYDTISSISFEKEWFNDFFFVIMLLFIFGTVCLIIGISANAFDNLGWKIAVINAMRVFFYPGVISLFCGIGALYFFITQANYFALISGAEKIRLYSNQDTLRAFIGVFEKLKSGKINVAEIQKIPELPIEERLSGRFIASFDNIGVKITFKDGNNKKRTISAPAKVEFTSLTMQIVATVRYELIKDKKYKDLIESNIVPLYIEESLDQMDEIAKELKVNWVYLLNISFDLKKTLVQGFISRLGIIPSKNLMLQVDSTLGAISIELSKKQFSLWSPASDLIKIEEIIKEFGMKSTSK